MQYRLSDVVGYDLLQPLATLLEGMDYEDPQRDHYLPPIMLVAGYAAASLVIAVVTVEAFVGATQYVLYPGNPPIRVLTFVEKEFPGSSYIQPLKEIFVVRDAIVHGHMWRRTVSYEVTPDLGVHYGSWELHAGYGDSKFEALVDLATQTTKTLTLNVKPSRLTSTDVRVVLKIALDFLAFLGEAVAQRTGRNPEGVINIENQRVIFKGKVVTFPEMVRAIESQKPIP